MKHFYKTLLNALTGMCLLFATTHATAQLSVNTSVTGTDLANSIIGGGVTVSNVNLECGANGAGIFSNGNATNLGIGEGVILTTGLASDVPNASSTQASTAQGEPGDSDLALLVNVPLNDACVLEFDFEPSANTISVQYVFGSEEYPEFVCSEFNDVFGFFVTGPNPGGGDYVAQNVALIPGSSDPITINHVNNNGSDCPPNYPQFYVDNEFGSSIVYDGFTVVFTAEVDVVPGEDYSFKFALADASDQIYDSGVFIKGESFSTFLCQSGQIGFNENLLSETSFCTYDLDKTVQLFNNVLSTSDFYEYALTDDDGNILEINESGAFDLDGYDEGSYHFYGVSYSGVTTGFEVGNNIDDIDAAQDEGCYEISDPVTAEIEVCLEIVCPSEADISCDESSSPDNTGMADIIGDPNGIFSVDYEDDVVGTCPTVITRTWFIADVPGVAPIDLSCTQTITVDDNDAPVIDAAEEITLECDEDNSNTYSVEDNCDENPTVNVSDSMEAGPCDGYYTIFRTITASDNCGNESSFNQVINVVDTTAPEFNEEINDLSVECTDDIPPFEECTATDNCDETVDTWSFEISQEAGDTTCALTAAVGPGIDWSLAMFSFVPGSDYYTFVDGSGNMEIYNDGTAVLTGTIQGMNTPSEQWDVYITLENKRNWNDWSDLGRSYKDDLLLAGDNYLDWMYYELDNENSFLIGAGDFAGSFLQLSHMPANYYYGFQCGLAANNKNANFGMSGWFFYEGFVNGEWVDGHGDVNVDKDCEPNNFETECEYEVERFWIAADDCGNVNIANQTISVEDTTAPEFTVTPDDLNLECYDEVPAPDASALEAVDNCGDVVEITFVEDVLVGTECDGVISRSYDAVDVCGNVKKHIQLITVLDNSAPVLEGVPGDLTLSCEQPVPAPADVTATDNCDDSVIVSFNETTVAGQCPQEETITRTWTAVDSCGNDVSATQVINIIDEIAPVIEVCPADASFDCIDDIPEPNTELVVANDNCGQVTVMHIGDEQDGDDCAGVIVRTYRVYDECENFTDCVQTFDYNDNVAPVFDNAPENIDVDCASIPDPADVTATDNCSGVTIAFSEIEFSGGCPGVIQRTWIATDDCGNADTIEQYINLIDTVAPTLFGTPGDVTIECDQPVPPVADVTATDNCDEAVEVDFDESEEAGACPQEYTIFRTWTATDTCENSTSYTQVITIVDTTAPTFTSEPEDLTVQCADDVPEPAEPMATDNCDDEVTISFNEVTGAQSVSSVTTAFGDEYALIIPTFIDGSDEYTFQENATFTEYTDGTARLQGEVISTTYDQKGWEVDIWLKNGTGWDEWNENDGIYVDENNLVTEEYTDWSYYVIDAEQSTLTGTLDYEGFFLNLSQAIYPEGNGFQVGNVANNRNTEWGMYSRFYTNGFFDGESVQGFGEIYLQGNQGPILNDECSYEITRTWTATDDCGNSTTIEQVILVEDTIAPEFTLLPDDLTVQCSDSIPVSDVAAEDNCGGDVNIFYTDFIVPGECENQYTIERTWVAEDACLNRSDYLQTIDVIDTQAPVFTDVPEAEITAECDDIPEPYSPAAEDNCSDSVMISLNEMTEPGECIGEYTLIRTWTATDDCENSSSFVQVINVVDNTPPVFVNPPQDMTVDCANLADPMDIEVEDNCGTVSIDFEEVEFSGGCPGVLQRTWIASDDCGNMDTLVQYINLIDTIAPTLMGTPGDVTINCDDDVPAPADVTAMDNCDDAVQVDFLETTEDGECPQEYSIIRTWSAMDTCENSVSYTQVITIVDEEAPVFNMESSVINVPCDNDDLQMPEPMATDNCDEFVDITVSDETTQGDCPNEWTVVYTWTATDDCGNSSSITWTVNYVDDVAPEFTQTPGELFFECIEEVPAPNTELLAATDNCGDVTITHVGDEQDGDDCDATISRTYRATDACDNFTDFVQTITVLDDIAPVLSGVPASDEVSCDNIPEAAVVTATDNCDLAVDVVFSENIEQGDCPQSYTIIRTWSAVDSCGNDVSASQSLFVYDDEAPMITECPQGGSYDCINDIPEPNVELVSATDNCGIVTITHVGDVQDGDECAGVIVRTYLATDECGNSTECVTTFSYEDDVAPTFDVELEDIDANCDDLPDPAVVTATDNCSEVNIDFSETVFSGGCPGVLERRWIAMDDCGNSDTLYRYITLIDTVAPELIGLPADASYECDEEIPAPAQVAAIDNCYSPIEVDYSESMEEGDCPQAYTILRTWTAEDNCENIVSYTQTISVSDNTDPVFDEIVGNITVSCDNVPAAGECTATDNCSDVEDIIISFEEVTSDGCPYTIMRTWTATDECGNSASQTQIITVVDEVAPILSLYPANMTVPCDDIPAAPQVTATDNCDLDLTVEFTESDFEGCAGSFTRTWSVTDWCNNNTTHVQTITVVDEVNPWFNQEVANVTVECDELPDVPVITASDNCDQDVEVAFNESVVDEECEGTYTLIRTWTATDDCQNTNELVQVITVEDNTAPVFVDAPANENYTCSDSIPEMGDCVAVDNCSSNITYMSEEHIEGYTGEDGLAQCDLFTPMDVVGAAWAVWLPNDIGEPQYYHLTETSGQFVELPNGRAHLTGTVYSPSNINKRWVIDVYFKNRKDWTEWSALGRSFKDDANVAGLLYETWDYYIMNADSAVLTGDGMYAGSSLDLAHAPASNYFGFQVGEAANNRNAADGMSGWFYYDGTWLGNEGVNGIGDFGFEKDCPECDYTITRIWTASDDCGNEEVAVQIITVQPGDEDNENLEESLPAKDPAVVLGAYPNPTAQRSIINFTLPLESEVTLEVFNMDGKLIETLYRGEAAANHDYKFVFHAGDLANGIYLYKLTTDDATYIERLMLAK